MTTVTQLLPLRDPRKLHCPEGDGLQLTPSASCSGLQSEKFKSPLFPPVRAKQEEGVELLPLCVGEIMKGTVVSGLFQEYNVYLK